MYCIKCGVKLQSGAESCPLCGLRVYHPEIHEEKAPGLYPEIEEHHRVLKPAGAQFIFTFLFALAAITCLVVNLKLEGGVTWAGYAMLGLLLLYSLMAPSLWFSKPNPVIIGSIFFAVLTVLVLYINLKTGGRWFLSFAFPVLGMLYILIMVPIILMRYIPSSDDSKIRLFIAMGWLLFFAGFLMLVEFLISITFHIPMIWWSIYPIIPLGFVAIFLLITALCTPLREALYKRFFV